MSETGSFPRPGPPANLSRPSRRRLAVSIAVVLLVAIAVAALLTFCGRAPSTRGGHGPGNGRPGAGGRPPTTVGTAVAAIGSIPIEQTALGTVTPMATVQVNARVSGELMRVGFTEGQMVRKGQLLMLIDPRPYEAALQLAQATLAHDQALLADAKLDLQRYATLKSQDSVAVQTYDTQAALVLQDQATVREDAANVTSAQLNLEFTHVVAPVSGRVGLRQIDQGNQVVANQTTPVTVVTQIDPITIIFPLPEDAIASVMARHGGAGLQVTALDRSGGAVLAQGRLLTLDNAVNTTTGTVNGRAEFNNADGKLFPFEFVNIVLLVDTLHNQIVVPTTAVRHGPKGDYVWLLQPNRTVKEREIVVGPGTAETVSVVSGVSVGDTVITAGGDRLRDGAPVVLPGQRAATARNLPGSGGQSGRHRGGGTASGG